MAKTSRQPVIPPPAPVPAQDKRVLFWVDEPSPGVFVPLRQHGTRIEELTTPGPYKAVAYERLSAAVMDWYLHETGARDESR